MSTITATSQPATSSSSLKRLISGHPLLAYFVIAFVGSWASLLPIALSRGVNGLGLLPYTLPDSVFYIAGILFTFAGPALASLAVTAIISGKAGVGTVAASLYTVARGHPVVPGRSVRFSRDLPAGL
jgi:hypothetical protein